MLFVWHLGKILYKYFVILYNCDIAYLATLQNNVS